MAAQADLSHLVANPEDRFSRDKAFICSAVLPFEEFSGTTWLQEIVFLIHSDFDMAQAQRVMIDDRFPYLEFMYPGAKEVASYPSPRFIKSHLPYSLLPSDIHEKKPKVLNNFIIWHRVWGCNNVMY